MPSSRTLILTDDAEADLAGIWQQTFERWTEQQAEIYTEQIWTILDDILMYPHSGRRRDEVKRGLRSRLAGEHVIFFRVKPSEVVVRRIVHQSRDTSGLTGL